MARQRLHKLGYSDSLNDLDSFTADILLLVDAEVEKLKADELKKLQKTSKSKVN